MGILGVSIDITEHKKTQQILLETTHKLEGMTLVSATITHELRTPLRSIISATNGIRKHLPQLMDAYALAKDASLPVAEINPAHYEKLINICDNIKSEADASFTIINMLLKNLQASSSNSFVVQKLKTSSIEHCIDEALRRYPYDVEESSLVHWSNQHNFDFKGDDVLVIHILFNLLKNSFYQIRFACKGDVHIWTELGAEYNTLHFKDTAKGIPAADVPLIFDRFFSKTFHGTGVGLAFCKKVMEGLGGHIECRSAEGEFAEFILHFPRQAA